MSAHAPTLPPPPSPGRLRRAEVVAQPVLQPRTAPAQAPAPPELFLCPKPSLETPGRPVGGGRRMASALVLATALNAVLVLLPSPFGPAGEVGVTRSETVEVVLVGPSLLSGTAPAGGVPPPAERDGAPTQAHGGPEVGMPLAADPGPSALVTGSPSQQDSVNTDSGGTAPAAEETRRGLAPVVARANPPRVATPERPGRAQAKRPRPAPAESRRPRPVASASPSPAPTAHRGEAAGPSVQPRNGEAGRPAADPLPALDTEAVPIVRVPPTYPLAAQTSRTEGRVLVEFTILGDGTVADPRVLESSPPGVFDDAVLQALRQWRFAPRVEDGRAVSRRARQTVRFSLAS